MDPDTLVEISLVVAAEPVTPELVVSTTLLIGTQELAELDKVLILEPE